MKVNNQLFLQDMKKPSNYLNEKTSSLLETGVFTFFKDPGVPFYLPIGIKILNNIQNILLEESEKLGISQIEIPAIVKNKVLEEGEEIVNTFSEKIVRISNKNLKNYHFLTTPEPMLLDLASISLASYKQLPIRFVYLVDVIRGLKKPKGMIKGRQFKTFMGNSFDKNIKSLEESLELFETLSDNVFGRIGVDTYKRKNQQGIDIEHFYFCSEGDNLIMPEIDPKNRVKAMSLSMTYQYNPNNELKAKFRNELNKNSRVLYATFGLGIQRLFYALLDNYRDEKGFNIPLNMAPFYYSIIPLGENESNKAEEIYMELHPQAFLDNRTNMSIKERTSFSEYIGVPWKIIIKNGEYILKNRDENFKKMFKNRNDLEKRIANKRIDFDKTKF